MQVKQYCIGAVRRPGVTGQQCRIGILVVCITLVLGGCAKKQDVVEVQANVQVNALQPAVYLAGRYPATAIVWGDYSGGGQEGNYLLTSVDPKQMDSRYFLIVEGASTPDSLRFYLDGSGHGPTVNKAYLGTFALTVVSDLPRSDVLGQFRLRRFSLLNQTRVPFSNDGTYIDFYRYAYPDHTRFYLHMRIQEDKKRKGTSSAVYYAYSDTHYATASEVGSFDFNLLSPGIIKY